MRIAPSIKNDKVIVAKKFKRDLPRSYAFIFEDPKEADEFYNFVNTKYDLDFQDVESNVPIEIDAAIYYMSFYESEIPTKTINLIPIVIDAKAGSNGNEPLLEDAHFSRVGNWYLVLTVDNSEMKDCLAPNYPHREKILVFLRELKSEYLTTHNYIESYLKGN